MSATLSFSLNVRSWEGLLRSSARAKSSYDNFTLDLQDKATGDTILTNPLIYTNQFQPQGEWVSIEVTLTGLDKLVHERGIQQVRLVLQATTDSSNPTAFIVDNLKFITHCQ